MNKYFIFYCNIFFILISCKSFNVVKENINNIPKPNSIIGIWLDEKGSGIEFLENGFYNGISENSIIVTDKYELTEKEYILYYNNTRFVYKYTIKNDVLFMIDPYGDKSYLAKKR